MVYLYLYITLSFFSIIFITKKNVYQNIILLNFVIILIFLFGLRNEIGGDWWVYEKNFNLIKYVTYPENLSLSDYSQYLPSDYILFNAFDFVLSYYSATEWTFNLISLFFVKIGLPIHFMNLFFTLIFFISLLVYLKNFENKFLALTISFPILIIVFSVGFLRQSIAFSFFLLAITYLIDNKKNKFLFFIILASLFHISILIFAPLFLIVNEKIFEKKNILRGFSLLIFFIIITILLSQKIYSLFYIYVVNSFETSQFDLPKGAIYRISLNLIAVVIFLIYSNKICRNVNEYRIYLYLSFLFIIGFILLPLFPVLVDRINYYLIPLQIFAFVKFTYFYNKQKYQYLSIISIIVVYGLVLLTWILFGTHSTYWLPFDNILINYSNDLFSYDKILIY